MKFKLFGLGLFCTLSSYAQDQSSSLPIVFPLTTDAEITPFTGQTSTGTGYSVGPDGVKLTGLLPSNLEMVGERNGFTLNDLRLSTSVGFTVDF